MANKIEVSIILALYNGERTLNDFLESVFSQDYPKNKFELLIFDGGSTDKSLSIIKKFEKDNKNLRLIHNPKKLGEGIGMGKDTGRKIANGKFVVYLDHDNIIHGKNWLENIIYPLQKDKTIMASQSLTTYKKDNDPFTKFINYTGVEDPFAIPFSLVSQVLLNPQDFKLIENKYYIYQLPKKNLLFGGSNGCAYRKEVFDIIGGHTRDLDIFTSMAEKNMKVAIPKEAKLIHKTAPDFGAFIKKRWRYTFNLYVNEYKTRKYRWIEKGFRPKISFALRVLYNLSIVGPFFEFLPKALKRREAFITLYPLYIFYTTFIYSIGTLIYFKNFLKYVEQ